MHRFLCLLPLLFSFTAHALRYVHVPEDLPFLFPQTTEQLSDFKKRSEIKFQVRMREFLDKPINQRAQSNTLVLWDKLVGELNADRSVLQLLTLVSPNKALRCAAEDALLSLNQTFTSTLSQHPQIYDIFASCSTYRMQDEGLYYLQETKNELRRQGLHLSSGERARLNALQQECAILEQRFEKNIQEDSRKLLAREDELTGLSESFKTSLQKTEKGDYLLTSDYPVYFPLMRSCNNEALRKKMRELFTNRAYPQNETVLKKLITKRDQIAQTIGYRSFAELQLSGETIGSPSQAFDFLEQLNAKADMKAKQEMTNLLHCLPRNISLHNGQKIRAWDFPYVTDSYLRENYALSEEEIAEYFPLQPTLSGLMRIYESFFDITIQRVRVSGLWHKDVQTLRISSKDGTYHHGYILLDLHPRENKYSHACMCPVIPPFEETDGFSYPAVAAVICNFQKPTGTTPALLRHGEVLTFFHEFGHALHQLFGRTNFIETAGTSVKTDFVELPSQLLEEWLWDRDILRSISHHYKTGLPLPDQRIDAMLGARNATSALGLKRQCALAFIALHLFEAGEEKDPAQIKHLIYDTYLPHVYYPEEDHFEAAFGHLTGYGARYYGYLYTRAIAADIFREIKKQGLLNPDIGKKYLREILLPGGSQDPSALIESFLGRKPSWNAYLEQIGL